MTAVNNTLELDQAFLSLLIKTYVFPKIRVPVVSMLIQNYVALEFSIYDKMQYVSRVTHT